MKISLVLIPSFVTIYGSNNGLLQSSTYANGDAIRYQYNNAGLVTGIYQDNNTESLYRTFAWDYSSNGTPRVHKDGVTALKYDYSYDSIGRLIRTDISNSSTSAYVGSTEYGYDVRNNLTSISNDIGGINYLQEYSYSKNDLNSGSENDAKDNLPTKYKALSKETVYTYNTLNQLIDVNFNTTTDVNKHYVYNNYTDANGNKFYTNQLNCETLNGTSYHYSYDNVGNITEIEKGTGYGTTTSDYRTYEYDVLDRLVVEKNNTNKQVVTYTYNHLGNITQKQIDTYTNTTLTGTPTTKVITYNYGNDGKTGWNYLLTSYDADSDGVVDTNERILYDGIGNPLTYRGATLAWYGRQLRSFTKNGITSTMTYDADGLRSSKTVAGVKTEYQYVGDKLFYEKRGDGNSFYYFYDSYGKLSAIYHHVNGNKTAYHVVTNAQGDVIALYSWTGTKVAEYSYDAWGNCTIVSDTSGTGIATLNPMRYRSYYYDSNLGLYYLQSRYYDSEIGRFINADNQISTTDVTGLNLFSYCGNNPINRVDPTGHAWYHWAIGAAVVAACAIATVVTCGGFATAATAVCMVSSGIAAATTASTIAAGAFIGSATVYGLAALSAACSSNSVEEFNDQGNWGTVAATALGGLMGGYDGYTMSKPQTPTNNDISRGSTGRTEPLNLNEQLAMEQVRSNPSAGTPITSITLNDPRWPSSEGWVKMQQIVPTSHGDINIHYVYNQTLNLYDDFKFCP